MKVNIGPYINWIGPYQIADKFTWLIGKDRADKFGDWLAETWLDDICQWIYSKKRRMVDIHIDRYDLWSLDHTLALIILPALKTFREDQLSFAYVDDEDIPEDLVHLEAEDKWNYILDEMIYAFESGIDDTEEDKFLDNPDGYTEYLKRTERGRILFAKYYHCLWT